jgi:hypothetical protein
MHPRAESIFLCNTICFISLSIHLQELLFVCLFVCHCGAGRGPSLTHIRPGFYLELHPQPARAFLMTACLKLFYSVFIHQSVENCFFSARHGGA